MNTHSGNAIDDYISIKSQLSNLGLQTWKYDVNNKNRILNCGLHATSFT